MLVARSADEIGRAPGTGLHIRCMDEPVIRLTRINKTPLAVNADLIKFVESAPDTVITLSTGEKLVVIEGVEQIIELVIKYRRSLLTGLSCPLLGLCLPTGSLVPRGSQRCEEASQPGR